MTEPESPFLDKHEVLAAIFKDPEAAPTREDALTPKQIMTVLESLARLGVNPDELVRKERS